MTILTDNIIITALLPSAAIVSSYKFLCLCLYVDVCVHNYCAWSTWDPIKDQNTTLLYPVQLLQITVINTKLFKEVNTWRGEHKNTLLHLCPSTLSVLSVIRSHKVYEWLSQPSCLTVIEWTLIFWIKEVKWCYIRRPEFKDGFTIKDCMYMYMYIPSSYRKAKMIAFQWIAKKETRIVQRCDHLSREKLGFNASITPSDSLSHVGIWMLKPLI